MNQKLTSQRKAKGLLLSAFTSFALSIGLMQTSQAQDVSGSERFSREQFMEAVDTCATESGITFEEGQGPTEEQRAIIDACLTAKNIRVPRHHGHHRPGQGQNCENRNQDQTQQTSATDSAE